MHADNNPPGEILGGFLQEIAYCVLWRVPAAAALRRPAVEVDMKTPAFLSAKELEAACRALVSVEKSNLGYEVQLPVIYPSGDFATVVVAASGDQFSVHDAGFAAMTLANHGMKLSAKVRARIAALSAHYGCEFLNDRMSRLAPLDQLPLAVAVIANASRTVADQLLQLQHQPVFSFRQEVVDRVRETPEADKFSGTETKQRMEAALLEKKA